MIADKLAKEFEKIRASLTKSKKLILADIDKIDEKYRRLAQEEKKNLTESLGILNEQLKYYDNMLGGISENTEDTSVEEQNPEEEPKIQDTIFPENNEPEEPEKQEEAKEAEVNTDAVITEDVPQPEKKEKGLTQEDIVEKLEVAGFKNIETVNGAEDVKTMPEDTPGEQAVEDIPELNSPDWGESNGEQKLDENGWPVW